MLVCQRMPEGINSKCHNKVSEILRLFSLFSALHGTCCGRRIQYVLKTSLECDTRSNIQVLQQLFGRFQGFFAVLAHGKEQLQGLLRGGGWGGGSIFVRIMWIILRYIHYIPGFISYTPSEMTVQAGSRCAKKTHSTSGLPKSHSQSPSTSHIPICEPKMNRSK